MTVQSVPSHITPREWLPFIDIGKEKPRRVLPESKYKNCSCGRKIKSERHVCEGDYVVWEKPMRMPDGTMKMVWVDTLQRTHRASGRPWKPDPPRGHDGRKKKR